MVTKKRRIHAYVWSGIVAALMLALLVSGYIEDGAKGEIASLFVTPILFFTFISCLILDNNFIGEMILTILSWGFIRMPGVIFTLDLDGIIWLLTVKLLFWVLGILLAILLGLLAVFLGLFLSVCTYPFAIYWAYRGRRNA